MMLMLEKLTKFDVMFTLKEHKHNMVDGKSLSYQSCCLRFKINKYFDSIKTHWITVKNLVRN